MKKVWRTEILSDFGQKIPDSFGQNQLSVTSTDNQDGDIPDDETEKETEVSDFDYDSLLAINSECIGWIRIDGTDIDYPVVQAADTTFYFHYNFNQASAIYGAIFMDYRNDIEMILEELEQECQDKHNENVAYAL